jgi:phosphoserine phosphatase RsbU/P
MSDYINEPYSIWVVEDNRLHAEMIAAALGPAAQIQVFDNGASLLEHVSSGAPLVDAVVLDWRLPDMSGLEVCRFLRTSFNEISLPIVMLTVLGNKGDIVEGLQAGANDYVTKPFDASELRARVRTLVRVKCLDIERRQAEIDREHYRELMLGMIGHDLRAPLSAISMGTQTLLLQEERSDAQSRVLVRIRNSSDRMARMIEQIMDFTRSRFGGIPIAREEVDIERLLSHCVEEFELANPAAELVATLSAAGRGYFDSDRMMQVIHNLLINAATHGRRGAPITLSAQSDDRKVTIEIGNQGRPIEPALLGSLFDPFRRGAIRPQQKGLGLGLYIARQIVDAHGGRIDVRSDASAGTRFTIVVPRRPN